MIKIYVMSTCPDCKEVKRMAAGDERFQLVDIGEHVRNLKEFMRLRDVHPKFEVARRRGLVGIPSFILEDGTVTFKPAEAGLSLEPEEKETKSKEEKNDERLKEEKPQMYSENVSDGVACNLDGTGC